VKLTKRAANLLYKAASYLAPVGGQGYSWWPRVLESFTGAWQQNVVIERPTVVQNWAVFSCATLIAGDIAKMPAAVMDYDRTQKIYVQTLNRPVLRKPNRFQTYVEFIRLWVLSLLFNGNTYVIKQRDERGFVVALYILDPCRVTPLISEDGGIYYQLAADNLSGIQETITVPASEIIHDRLWTIYHPLIGVSPIFACGIAAMQSAAIQQNSALFFQNMSRPSGVLTAPGSIGDETAARLKASWEEKFSGANAGKVAVLGDGLKYEAMTITAVDSQLIEQLKFSGEMICATFHVPPYKLGLGQMPTVNNVSALNQQYYDQALQPIVENMERHLKEGLEVSDPSEVWLDEGVLLRMDPATRMDSHIKAISGALLAPNEARRMENWAPQIGGDVLYLQQQNFSLEALAKRDAREDPFSSAKPVEDKPALPAPSDSEDEDIDDEARAMADVIIKGLMEPERV
jgi:HK97 family phage portal protein